MKLRIYDYENRPVDIELPDKPIHSIFVLILSGDETGRVEFEDGETFSFDADAPDSPGGRGIDYCDGYYTVDGDMIPRWMAYRPHVSDPETAAYKRRDWFRKQKESRKQEKNKNDQAE